MSLRLLQKAVSSDADANRGRGKGRGAKRATPMSLQHFHEQTASVSAVGSTRHSAWSKGASRSSPSLSAEEADATGRTARPSAGPSAWAKGPPSSAVENLWSAAPAADADEDDWQAPAHEAEPLVNEYVDDWGTDTTAGPTEAYSVAESPTRIEASQEAPCDGDGGGEEVQEPQEPQEPVDPTDEDQEAESLGTDVALWLSHLNLADQKQAVLAWCEEMGAASLEEVIESIEDLAQALALKPLQEKRLQNRAAEAFEKVRASEAAEANADAAATGAGPSTAPQGTSYYDGASSSRAGSKETSAVARAQSFYKSCGQEAEDNYLKQRPTEVAVWVPSAKKSQGERKRQKKPASEAAEEKEAEKARREAERRLEEQLREEHERKLKECRDLIADALDRTDSQAFATALAAAKKAGLSPEEGKEAQEKLNLALRRRTQRRHDALCALQASLEAPKDESFGPAVQKALEEAKAEGVLEHVPGGREAARDAEAALHDWEIAEQQRQESRMALQFALRRGEVGALQVALSEAKAAGLPDDSELMTEAASLVQELLEKERLIQEELLQKERLKQEAITKRERALAEEDLQLLEEAIALCRQQGLPLQGAEETLQRWRLQAEERQAAELQLQAALESEDSAVLRKAIASTRTKASPEGLRAAEDRLVEMEARAKRREMAQLELCLAQNSRDIRRLGAALELARAAGVNLPEQQEAEEVLADLIQQDSLRREALQRLAEAAKLRDLAMLKQALSASDILSEDAEVQKSKALLLELEEEARAEAEAARRRAAAEAIEAAVAEGDWGKIESALSAGLELGLAEEGAPVRAAHAKLESLREARELEEAQAAVEEAEARLLELQKKEHSLVGAKHKKERSAIGKEMMAIRNSEAYISARNFLKSPDQERKRRQEQRVEIEKRAADERDRRRLRAAQAPAELLAAIKALDEDAVRALLIEAVLTPPDASIAEGFLAESEERRTRAERDGALLEFGFPDLDRRAFFQASVAVASFLTDQYRMHEGSDFKLKVIKAANSVLVTFRSAEYAQAVRETTFDLAKQLDAGSTSAQALLRAELRSSHGPAFSAEADELLSSLRQDAEALREKPLRAECEEAVRSAAARARGELPRRTGPSPLSRASTEAPAAATGAKEQQQHHAPPAAPMPDQQGHISGGSLPSRTSTVGACSKGKGGGKVSPGAGAPKDDVLVLPRGAAFELQRDTARAKTFRDDLRTFARNFRIQAELVGLDKVQMKPLGFVHQDTREKARAELQNLLNYHFPSVSREREVRLRVAESGAGIDLTPSDRGFQVDHVEEFPGQDFSAGEVILAINGHKLSGLSEDEVEETFGAHFGDGAVLMIGSA